MKRLFLFILLSVTLINVSGQVVINPYAHQVVTASTPTAFGPDAIFYFDASRTKTMFQEVSTGPASAINVGVPLTPSTTDGNLVGFIYDLGPHAMYLTNTGGNTTRPTLSSDGTRHSFLQFDGSTTYLILQNSTIILRPAHQTATITWEVAVWAKKSVDGTAMTLYTNSDGATNQRGIYLSTTTGNKIIARIGDGDGSLMANYTSTAGWAVADSWTVIRFYRNGATAGIQIGNNAVETFAVSGGVTNNASNELRLGASSTGNGFNGGIAQVLMLNRLFTADEVTDFKSFNPVRNSANFRVIARKYDFNNASKCFQETTRTTTATNGATIALVDNDVASNFGPYLLPIQTSTAANEPTFRTNVSNGLSALEYDGTNDNLSVTNVPPRGGSCTWYFVVSNDDNTAGSQFADCGYPAYGTLTGNSYDGTSPRFAFHTDAGAGTEGDVVGVSATANSINIVAYRIYGQQRTLFNMNGSTDTDVATAKQWAPQNFGLNANGDTAWNHDGYALYYLQVHGYESDSEVQTNIAALKTAYGL